MLASSAVDDRAEPAPTSRLVAWSILVALLIAVAYASRVSGGKPDPQVLYRWSTAVGSVVQDAIVLGVVLAIAGGHRRLLALRRPVRVWHALALLAAILVAIYVWEAVYSALAHPGNEQGLTPSHWEPRRAAEYVVNGLVICTWIPFVEELTFRGLGYSLLARFGRWPAIAVIGIVFGLAHGLVVSLPVLVAFGWGLAWLRSRTDSAVPGMVLHGTFNLIALVVAVVR